MTRIIRVSDQVQLKFESSSVNRQQLQPGARAAANAQVKLHLFLFEMVISKFEIWSINKWTFVRCIRHLLPSSL
jgi:hypothetical protein